jgi:hypothetical protein
MVTIPRRVPRNERMPVPQTADETPELVRRWWTNKQLEKKIKTEQEGPDDRHPGYRKRLLDIIVKTGRKIDPKGHKAITFDPPIAGLHGLKAQRSAPVEFQTMVAEGLLRKKGGLVLQACTTTMWAFRDDKIPDIVEALDKAGILNECVADGYPMKRLDPDRVLRYHQLHKDEVTEKDMDLMFIEVEGWSLIPLTAPLGEIPDVD